MANPNDPREDLIEKLGRMEDQVRREEHPLKLIVLVYVVMAILLGIGMVAVLAAEPYVYSSADAVTPKGRGVQFTRPDGTPIYINPHTVAFVRAPLQGELGKAVIVFSSGAKQAVAETVEQVISGIHIEDRTGDDPP